MGNSLQDLESRHTRTPSPGNTIHSRRRDIAKDRTSNEKTYPEVTSLAPSLRLIQIRCFRNNKGRALPDTLAASTEKQPLIGGYFIKCVWHAL